MSEPWIESGLLWVVGMVAGTLNVLAGGGSLITLPVLIFLGLPPSVANGTNRVAILGQNVTAVWRFNRLKLVDWGWLLVAAGPAVAGAVLGTWAALVVDDQTFRRLLAGIMLGVALWTLIDPMKRFQPGARLPAFDDPRQRVWLAAGFFVAGVFGGFVQAGVGFLILALATVAGLDLVRGNALKVLVVLSYTPVALALFMLGDRVDWRLGLALAAGNVTGAFIGVHLTALKGHVWIKRFVTVTVVAFAIRLLVNGS